MVPPRIHIFLWLVAYNKIMTRDNMQKRNMGKPVECVFCLEHESVQHLFFDCLITKLVWEEISSFFSKQLGISVELMTSCWVAGKKMDTINSVVAAVLWSLWKHRNNSL